MSRPVSEMQERIARAIYEDRNGAGCMPWSRRDKAHKQPYRRDALAAMKAELEKLIARGRSTPGPDLSNDVPVQLIKKSPAGKAKTKAKKK